MTTTSERRHTRSCSRSCQLQEEQKITWGVTGSTVTSQFHFREAHQYPIWHFCGHFSYSDNNCIVCGGARRSGDAADHLPQTSLVCEQHAHLQLKVKPGQLVCEEQTQSVRWPDYSLNNLLAADIITSINS